MPAEKSLDVVVGAVEDDLNVIVSSVPRLPEDLPAFRLERTSDRIPEPVGSLPQGGAPLLVPVGVSSRIAAAVAVPAFDAMRATPCAPLPDFGLMCRWMKGEVLAVVRQSGEVVGFDMVQSVSQRHVALFVVMAIGFTVGRDVDNLRPCPAVGKCGQQPAGKIFAFVEEMFERDSLRNGPIVEEHSDTFTGRQVYFIRH